MNFPSPAYLIFFVHSSTENQLNILSLYMVADDNINYLRKFIMLYSKEDLILIHNLRVLKGCGTKNQLVLTKGLAFTQSELSS